MIASILYQASTRTSKQDSKAHSDGSRVVRRGVEGGVGRGRGLDTAHGAKPAEVPSQHAVPCPGADGCFAYKGCRRSLCKPKVVSQSTHRAFEAHASVLGGKPGAAFGQQQQWQDQNHKPIQLRSLKSCCRSSSAKVRSCIRNPTHPVGSDMQRPDDVSHTVSRPSASPITTVATQPADPGGAPGLAGRPHATKAVAATSNGCRKGRKEHQEM